MPKRYIVDVAMTIHWKVEVEAIGPDEAAQIVGDMDMDDLKREGDFSYISELETLDVVEKERSRFDDD